MVFAAYTNPTAKRQLDEAKDQSYGPLAQASQLTIDGRPILESISAA